MKKEKIKAKDLITVGIFTAIQFVVCMAVAMLGYIPIFIPLLAVLVPLIGGIPFMLFLTNRDAYKILISTMLSLRTKDSTTRDASMRLFEKAGNPKDMLKLSEEEIAKLIYPVGFYRVKAKNILEVSQTIIDDYNGKVPDEIDELLKLRGVGRKVANLVVTEAFDKYGICVDTHVHRISNRFG